jgi:hypothetical protein
MKAISKKFILDIVILFIINNFKLHQQIKSIYNYYSSFL